MNPLLAKLSGVRPWLGRRAPWLVLLLLSAFCYYASYYRYGINFKDEGGTVTLLAKRLLAGERPFIDVVLGYNVGWFYPIVGLFKLFGVNFVLLRVYCFALSTITAVLGFLVVIRTGGRPWLAFLVGLLLVLVPGMTFKNYMPLLAVGNAFCLVHFALAPRPLEAAKGGEGEPERAVGRGPWHWICVGGLALGLTYLIRIDVGIFCTLLWLGGIWLRAFEPGGIRKESRKMALGGPVLLLALIAALHVPVYADAVHRGFGHQFLAQYLSWPKSIVVALEGRFAPAKPPATLPRPALSAGANGAEASPPAPSGHVSNRGVLKRKTFDDLKNAKNAEDRRLILELILLLYAPLFSLTVLTLAAAVGMVIAFRMANAAESRRMLGALLLLGAALTTFPQYFFFRPDGPHLSEFSPGFWVAVTGSCLLLGAGRGGFKRWQTWPGWLLILFLTLHAGLYLGRMLPDRFSGTIGANRELTKLVEEGKFKQALHPKHTKAFHGANGVDILVSEKEATELTAIEQIVEAHSKPSDYLVAYPYHPSFNVIADRPTYEKNVYVDNATRSAGWDTEAIARLEKFKPAIVILSDWAINGSEESRFSVWAEKTKTWIQTHYTNRGTYLDFEVYTRDSLPESSK